MGARVLAMRASLLLDRIGRNQGEARFRILALVQVARLLDQNNLQRWTNMRLDQVTPDHAAVGSAEHGVQVQRGLSIGDRNVAE